LGSAEAEVGSIFGRFRFSLWPFSTSGTTAVEFQISLAEATLHSSDRLQPSAHISYDLTRTVLLLLMSEIYVEQNAAKRGQQY